MIGVCLGSQVKQLSQCQQQYSLILYSVPVPDQKLFGVGFMAGSCLKACNLCYPTLPAAELMRRQATKTADLKEDHAQGKLDTAPLNSNVFVVDASPQLNKLIVDDGVHSEASGPRRMNRQGIHAFAATVKAVTRFFS